MIDDDRQKNKLYDIAVKELKLDLDDKDDGVFLFKAKADMLVKSFAFNLAKGSFIKGKTFRGKFELGYDKKLKLGDEGLSEKDEIIVLTKTDVAKDLKVVAKKVAEFKKINKKVFVISLFDDKMVKKFSDELIKILQKKQ